jgi:hypothetical protein
MYSQTFVGRDIFETVWALGVLAAAAGAGTVQFPFDPQLRDFVAAHRGALESTWPAIQDAVCLNDDIMWIPEGDAPWSGAPDKYPDIDSLKAHLVLADPDPERYLGTDRFERLVLDADSIQEAVGHLLGTLLGRLLSGRWAFCESARGGSETPVQLRGKLLAVFHAIHPLLRDSGVCAGEPETLLATAWDEWRRTVGDAWIADPSTETGFREWLKAQVPA